MHHTFYRIAILAVFVSGCALISGCSAIYLPAIYDTNMPAQIPLRMESTHTYAGAEVGYSDGFNRDESNIIARGHVTWASGGKGWRASIGAFGHAGSYHVTQSFDSADLGHKSYFGLGTMADINVGIPGDEASVGLGLNFGGFGEFGQYSLVWHGEGEAKFLPMIGLYAFATYKLNPQQTMGIQFHTGLPGGLSANVQFDNGEYLVWGGIGASVVSSNTDQAGIGRFVVGLSVRIN